MPLWKLIIIGIIIAVGFAAAWVVVGMRQKH